MAKKRRLSWAVMIDGRSIWTLNAVPKRSQYGESLRKFRGEEYRRWDPTRSKLGAGLSRARNTQYELLPDEGDTCLYLGAGRPAGVRRCCSDESAVLSARQSDFRAIIAAAATLQAVSAAAQPRKKPYPQSEIL